MGADRLAIVQIGKGNVGAALIDQVGRARPALRERLGVDLVYAGIAGRTHGVFAPDGLDLKRWRSIVGADRGLDGAALLKEAVGRLAGPAVLVDATSEGGLAGLYARAFEAGFHIISCNKKPLAGSLADYRRLKDLCRRRRRFWYYEVTVGAGLPVIQTLRDLLDSGDRLMTIEGCFSGTLNYLCAALDRGEKFSKALARARKLGYTEPDPREDLGGQDVARKALILARESGLELEPEGVRLEPFCPVEGGGVETFMKRTTRLDGDLAGRWRSAARRDRRRRYVARVDRACGAGPVEVRADSALGRLAGPENVFCLRTERYADHPLVVSGPGAGPEVTATGTFGDLIRIARALGRAG